MEHHSIDMTALDYNYSEREGLLRRLGRYVPYQPLFWLGPWVKRVWEPCSRGIVPYFQFRRFLDRSQWWSLERLKEYQDQQLRELVAFAYHNVPYYTELFQRLRVRPEDIQTGTDLQKLPVLTRVDVLKNYDKLIASSTKNKDIYTVRTSGSSGDPLTILRDKRFLYMSTAFNAACYRIAGVDMYARSVQARAVPFLKKAVADHMYDPYWHQLVISSLPGDTKVLDHYVDMIRRVKPSYMMGWPSFMHCLAEHCRERGIGKGLFPVCVSYAENLYSFQRQAIKEQFDCDVFDLYRFSEKLVSASECACHQGLHVDIRQGVLEIVDAEGRQVNAPFAGRVICTGFDNRVMLLIRYEVGDIASYSLESCSCGRGLPLLSGIQGRRCEQVMMKGKNIYPTTLSDIIRPYDRIGECQFIKRSDSCLELLTTAEKASLPVDKMQEDLKKVLGDEINIIIQHVPRIGEKYKKFSFLVDRSK